jgi:NitT/TauT family transport system ATP-binding protein
LIDCAGDPANRAMHAMDALGLTQPRKGRYNDGVIETGFAKPMTQASKTSTQPVISFEGVHHAFGEGESEVEVVRDFSLPIGEGEFVSLIGPSGCGKSTLLGMASGFLQPKRGTVQLFGKPPISMRKHIGMVFQSFSLLPWRTVLDNITLGLEFRGVPQGERTAMGMELISSLGLSGFENRHPRELSGGMNQRVTLARALVLKPSVLLLDEPFGALDEQTRTLIGDELFRLWQTIHPTTLLVTHSISEAVRLSTRVVVLTCRPTRLKKIVPINLKGPRTAAQTASLEEEIWELLKDEATRAMLGKATGHGG